MIEIKNQRLVCVGRRDCDLSIDPLADISPDQHNIILCAECSDFCNEKVKLFLSFHVSPHSAPYFIAMPR